MALTRNLGHGFRAASESTSFSMSLDHLLMVGPVALALVLAGVLIWLGG
jgi:hypothetical protein